MEDAGDTLNGSDDVSEPEKPEARLEVAQSILSKFSMKTLFGLTSKLDSVKPDEEAAVLKAFHSLPQLGDPSKGSEQQPKAEAQVPPDPRNDSKAAGVETESEGSQGIEEAGISLPGQEPLPLGAQSVNRDDVILVRGTLVNTTSDSDSDDGGQQPEEGSHASRPQPPSVLSEPSQDPKERLRDWRENSTTGERDDAELCAEGPQRTPPEISSKPQPGDGGLQTEHCPTQGQAAEESSPVLPTVTAQNVSVGVAEDDSSKKEVTGEKSFQLPAFFSGLRVLKKGATGEGGKTITEIKPKDGDLALLKLTQPVQKSLVQAGPPTVKTGEKTTDPKATPTLLEQLSQLFILDMPKAEVKAEDPEQPRKEEMGCSAAQESQDGPSGAQTQGGEIKPKPPETALEAFKAIFVRPPKRGTTADTSELEALKRKMKHEKESLRAVFERSRSRPGDGPSESKSPDHSPTEQDDRTPGRLQAVWPPPKTKDTEEKVGLKYTEAGNVKRSRVPVE